MNKGVMIEKKLLIVLMAVLLLVSSGGYAVAQIGEKKNKPELVIDPILGATSSLTKMPIYQKKTYHETTYENLSKLYWAMGVHSLGDDNAIDGFLRINECDLFQKYYGDDFKWTEIRDATRKLIRRERQTYPTSFEIILPLAIGRYDIQKEAFLISDDTRFRGMTKISIDLARFDSECGKSLVMINGYPGSVIMFLNQPFTLTEVPVKPEIADLFIHEATVMVGRSRANFERDAYLRVLVTFSSYIGFASGMNGKTVVTMHAKIDAVEVFADASLTKPLYIKDFAEVRRRHKNRVADQSLKEEVDKALTFLGESEDGGADDMMDITGENR